MFRVIAFSLILLFGLLAVTGLDTQGGQPSRSAGVLSLIPAAPDTGYR